MGIAAVIDVGSPINAGWRRQASSYAMRGVMKYALVAATSIVFAASE